MEYLSLRHIVLVYLVIINLVTFIMYGIDKLQAKKSKWRFSEALLLKLAIIGGSIGAWLGMKTCTIRRCTRNSSMVFQLSSLSNY